MRMCKHELNPSAPRGAMKKAELTTRAAQETKLNLRMHRTELNTGAMKKAKLTTRAAQERKQNMRLYRPELNPSAESRGAETEAKLTNRAVPETKLNNCHHSPVYKKSELTTNMSRMKGDKLTIMAAMRAKLNRSRQQQT